MFFIGLAAGALVMFILIMIYSSLAVASRADKHIRADTWEYYKENLETGEQSEEEYDTLS